MNIKRILYLGLDPTHFKSEGEVIHWPIIQISPRPFTDPEIQLSLRSFACYTHVMITSKSTVPLLANYLQLAGFSLESWIGKSTLAIGQVTAQQLKLYGITPFLIAKEETAEGLVKEMHTLLHAKTHVFWPHSALARPVLKAFFLSQNIPHTSCNFYDTVYRQIDLLPDLKTFDEIVFTSPSTVDAFLHAFGHFPAHALLTSIGPVTKGYLQRCIKNSLW